MRRFFDSWRTAWRVGAFRDQFLVSILGLIIAVVAMRFYLGRLELRTGVLLNDPLLSIVPAVELNWIIFTIVYSGMVFGLASLVLYPFSFLLTMRALILMILLRILCLYLLPLDPPAGSIPLVDPLVQMMALRFVSPHALFFSWETATMALLALTARWRDVKIIFACAAAVISVLLLLQRTHYTIDVVAAPCFAYAAFGLAKWITVRDIGELRLRDRGEKPAAAKS